LELSSQEKSNEIIKIIIVALVKFFIVSWFSSVRLSVSSYSIVSFSGNVEDVTYDIKAKRIIFRISKDIAAKVINLKDYY
jgi:hypothetical protein|tara:strand:- start:2330 stop:2569 length:240 start_codon:yes stop_codon:yes gene_type:complete